MSSSKRATSTVTSKPIEPPNSVPHDRLGNNGAVSSMAAQSTDAAVKSLERQNASFGSFDFLKLLETGPHGKSQSRIPAVRRLVCKICCDHLLGGAPLIIPAKMTCHRTTSTFGCVLHICSRKIHINTCVRHPFHASGEEESFRNVKKFKESQTGDHRICHLPLPLRNVL